MWLLNLLPTGLIGFFVHGMLLVGIAGMAVSYLLVLPLISKYKLPLRMLSAILIAVGVFGSGMLYAQKDWEAKVKELEGKVAVAEEKAKHINKEVEIVYKDRVKVVTQTKIKIEEKIVEKEKIINATCKLNDAAIELHNQATKKPVEAAQ